MNSLWYAADNAGQMLLNESPKLDIWCFSQPLNDFERANNKGLGSSLKLFASLAWIKATGQLIATTMVQWRAWRCAAAPSLQPSCRGWFLEQEAPPWPLLPPLRLVYVPMTSCISLSFLRPANSPAGGWIHHDILALAQRVHVCWNGNLIRGETLLFNTWKSGTVMPLCRH